LIKVFLVLTILSDSMSLMAERFIAIVGGSIIDGTGRPPIQEGVIIVNGSKIAAVGSHIDILIPEGAERIEAKGRTVMPGFIDSHTHFILMGVRTLTTLDLSKTRSMSEFLELIKERVQKVPNGLWLEGHGWDESSWPERRYPSKWDLDAVSPNIPVVLTPYYGHLMAVNSAALEAANVSKDTTDPPGGEVVKDPETREPTGILRDKAMRLISEVKPAITREISLKGLRKACEIALSWGCTSIHELDADPVQISTYQTARQDGTLTVRAYVMPSARYSEELIDSFENIGLSTGFGDEFYRIGAAKIFIDGSMGARTAVFSEPYEDDPSTKGLFTISPKELKTRVAKAHGNGMQIATHAIGDGGIKETLDAYEMVLSEDYREDHRHRIEHCEILYEEQIQRIKRLGVVPSMQPNFVGQWGGSGGMYYQRLGSKRLKLSNPYRRLLDEGIRVAFGSDCGYCPPWPMNPLFGLWSAVMHPNEESRISLEEAVKAYTLDAAYASFEDDIKGSLEQGKLADIIILSHDLTTIDPDEIKNTNVDLTMVGGKIEYRKRIY
jgi:predicted amidohydrolase YtcJ